jgi:hypothetical protein
MSTLEGVGLGRVKDEERTIFCKWTIFRILRVGSHRFLWATDIFHLPPLERHERDPPGTYRGVFPCDILGKLSINFRFFAATESGSPRNC